MNFYHEDEVTPPPQVKAPVELQMRSLPAYRIEPPDLIQIEVLKLVPPSPYHIEQYDVLQVNAINTLLKYPINGYFLVEAEGNIDLGPAYGTVRVQGMTIQEAHDVIKTKLVEVLANPEVSVQLARASGLQPITGTYLVGPDGTVNLRQYGSVYLSGKTLSEAKKILENHLRRGFLDSPEVSVDVAAYNSKVYYVITAGGAMGDNVMTLPITGNETVLDAIGRVQGLSQLSSKRMWIARPAPAGTGCEQILPIEWDAIAAGAVTDTNYQVLPGDRVYIKEDPMMAFSGYLNRIIGPFERVAGFSSLIASAVRNLQLVGYRQTSGGY
ncbi:MAG: polysaccharide biosynthesis/export family protein [Planctomycetia bacterium]|jgi:polysaccharide export outer membrane protein